MNPINKLADSIRKAMAKRRGEDLFEEEDLEEEDLDGMEDLAVQEEEPVKKEAPKKPQESKKKFSLKLFHKKEKKSRPAVHREPREKEKGKESKKKEAGSRKNKRIAFLLTLILIMLGFGGAYFYMDQADNSAPTQQNPQVAVNTQNKKNASEEAPKNAGDVNVNPFVDATMLKKLPTAANASVPTLPRTSAPNVVSAPSTSSYPAFSAPRPSLPAIPSSSAPASVGTLPPVSVPSNVPTQSPAEPPGIQGIITDDSGNNMAIMNDGTVVSQGETYNDGRIAYIGGDGIKFEDGSTMSYSQ